MGPVVLHYDLHQGNVAQYVVRIKQSETGATKENRPVIAFPVRITVVSTPTVEITTGPMNIGGRSVGRAKVSRYTSTPQGVVSGSKDLRPVSLFGIALPAKPVTVGATWRSGVTGQSPIPAGLVATCKLKSTNSEGAVIEWKTQQGGTTKVDGSGTLIVGRNGVVRKGQLAITITYLRPDKPGAPLKVNSTVKLGVAISPN